MDFIRIGDKLVSRQKIIHMIDKALERRVAGASQQEVASMLGVDRSFVSRLETLGEIRKGQKIAIIGFPIGNKDELMQVAKEFGVDYCYLLTDEERWRLANESSGADLINEIMRVMAHARTYDTLIFIGSDMRIRFAEAMVDKQLIPINIGQSPIKGDRYVDPDKLRKILQTLQDHNT
ncbi:MAG: helix-turn-helix domain-containing protein [Firmicutes bacterium]|nr:helix-turn-helix domain-containing protein [Bacillota bacterium]